jgi:hypothetical protein
MSSVAKIGIAILAALILWNIYTGATVQEISFFDVGTIKFGTHGCNGKGTVVNEDNSRPLAGADVLYVSDGQAPRSLAHSGPDGTFRFICSGVDKDRFPLHVFIGDRGKWSWCLFNSEQDIDRVEGQDINLSVSFGRMVQYGQRSASSSALLPTRARTLDSSRRP